MIFPKPIEISAIGTITPEQLDSKHASVWCGKYNRIDNSISHRRKVALRRERREELRVMRRNAEEICVTEDALLVERVKPHFDNRDLTKEDMQKMGEEFFRNLPSTALDEISDFSESHRDLSMDVKHWSEYGDS